MKRHLILLLFFLSSCSIGLLSKHERKVERAKSKIQKLVKKYPELKFTSTDTVEIQDIRIDTLITKQIDTTVVNKITHDTVTIETERAVVKYRVVKDSVYLGFHVKPDTLIKIDTVYREIITNTDVINTEKNCMSCVEKYTSYVVWLFIIIFVAFGIYKLVIRSIKPF